MYCYQPPLQHMYCPSQPPFHQVGLRQVACFPGSQDIMWCVVCVVWYVGVYARAHLDGRCGSRALNFSG